MNSKNFQSGVERVRRFWGGEGRCIASVTSQREMYRQMDDLDQMARKAALNLDHQLSLPGVNIPTLIADFGTVTTARYWGGTVRRDSTGENIHISPVAQTSAEASNRVPRTVDAPNMDFVRIMKLFERVKELVGHDEVWLRIGDLQGTLNTAGLVMNQENLLCEMYSDPEDVHVFLGKVCSFLIEYVQRFKQAAPGRLAGSIWPYIVVPDDLGFMVTEDMMPLMSADLYKEFGIPYLTRMTQALGPAQIHCCGEWGHHAANLAASDAAIRSVECWYPFTPVEQLRPLVDKGVVLVPLISLDKCNDRFGSAVEYYRDLLRTTDETHRYWFPLMDESQETFDFVNEIC